MNIKFFKNEIIRAYNVLGSDRGEMQNCTDINRWFTDGIIDKNEKDCLNEFNKKIHNTMKGDE